MRLNVGVTDFDWYSHLATARDFDEVNFWSPGGASFKVLKPGELFLFKLKAAHNHVVVGGGIFAHDTLLPLSLAWGAFGQKNGVANLEEMQARIRRYLSAGAREVRDPVIGCRLLQQPFFFAPDQWFRVPDSFPVNAVSGKSYRLDEAEGAWLYRAVEERLSYRLPSGEPTVPGVGEVGRTGKPQIALPRLGQGTFRIAVTDHYERRCAVTEEKTLPLLDAAHIKPWNEGGEHRPDNGILLRTDVHRLFDLGYVTISHDHRFEVSPKLVEDYGNGRHYYALHGQPIRPPTNSSLLPSKEALDWHHANRWTRPGFTG
ncbi:MAG: HNH endonuclease [Caulobacter sp.]|nr:HNH endonuclease [Caulobacter sp.]